MVKPREPLTVTLDIETSPRIGLFFGPEWKANIAKVVQESFVFGFAWKPLGKKVQTCYIWDFPLYKKDPKNDIEVIKKWLEVVSEADIVVGQNSRKFDDRVMMGRVIFHQLPPPEPFATVDTKADLKRVADFDSFRLDYLSKQFGYGGKMDTGGINLWWDCLNGDPKAQAYMVKYNKRDVIETEKVYLHERPYIKHPALNVLGDRPDACPKCGKSGTMLKGMKYRATSTNLYQYFRCKECGGMAKERIPEYKQAFERMRYVQ